MMCMCNTISSVTFQNMYKNQVWNLFGQVMALSQDIRHNRFCLRLMVKVTNVLERPTVIH